MQRGPTASLHAAARRARRRPADDPARRRRPAWSAGAAGAIATEHVAPARSPGSPAQRRSHYAVPPAAHATSAERVAAAGCACFLPAGLSAFGIVPWSPGAARASSAGRVGPAAFACLAVGIGRERAQHRRTARPPRRRPRHLGQARRAGRVRLARRQARFTALSASPAVRHSPLDIAARAAPFGVARASSDRARCASRRPPISPVGSDRGAQPPPPRRPIRAARAISAGRVKLAGCGRLAAGLGSPQSQHRRTARSPGAAGAIAAEPIALAVVPRLAGLPPALLASAERVASGCAWLGGGLAFAAPAASPGKSKPSARSRPSASRFRLRLARWRHGTAALAPSPPARPAAGGLVVASPRCPTAPICVAQPGSRTHPSTTATRIGDSAIDRSNPYRYWVPV
jgi:hypothetical protein